MILNEELTLDKVGCAALRAFLGTPARRLLGAGTWLYKFTGAPLVNAQGGITPWWSSVEPLEASDLGLAKLIERSERLGVSPGHYARARNAVTKQWNSMENLVVIRLTQPSFALIGRCAAQPIDQEEAFRNVFYIGGAWQLYLPNLTLSHLQRH